MSETKTLKQFISDAVKVHGYKYNYSKTEYINTGTKVKIICKKHGEFLQRACTHLRGAECPICGEQKRIKSVIAKASKEFISKARKIHGYRYDYSLVKYKKAHKKVKIICKKHGVFLQTPSLHFVSGGCFKCRNENLRHTTGEFIKSSMKKHKGQYTYKKCHYVTCGSKVCITCPSHGDFWQTPDQHLKGHGCKKCGSERMSKTSTHRVTKTTFCFIKSANKIHKNKYDYSLTNYQRCNKKVVIGCPEHGKFRQAPTVHLRGAGCPKCGQKKCTSKRTMTTKKFIERAQKVHGDKYDYSLAHCVKSTIPVIIICKKHGQFTQSPNGHVNLKNGCKLCSFEKLARDRKLSVSDFIRKAKVIFGNLYSYKNVRSFKNSHDKVEIICKKHGKFLQVINGHLCGRGCPKCQGITLKDGTWCASITEAFMYLKYKSEGFVFFHNRTYDKRLGAFRYDFYFPKENKYIEVTGFSNNINKLSAGLYKKYVAKIRKKKKFVVNVLKAKFEFVQKILSSKETQYVYRHAVNY